jgi:hypothetical protein
MRSNTAAAKLICSLIENGKPAMFFGGWGSFGSGSWQETALQKHLGFATSPNDTRQSYLSYERSKLADDLHMPDTSDLGPTGGYHEIHGYDLDKVILWGKRSDNRQIIPLLLSGSNGKNLVFTGYVTPDGGKRFCFSAGFLPFMQWVLRFLTHKHVATNQHPNLFRQAFWEYCNGGRPTLLIEQIIGSPFLNNHGLKFKHILLKAFSELCGAWDMAALIARRTATHEKSEYGRLMRLAESERDEALGAQAEYDWESVVSHYGAAARYWREIAEKYPEDVRSKGFTRYYAGLQEQARVVLSIEQRDWDGALSILRDLHLHNEETIKLHGHAIATDIHQSLEFLSLLADTITASQTLKFYRPIRAARVLLRLRKDAKTLECELARLLTEYSSLDARVAPPKWRKLQLQTLTRVERELLGSLSASIGVDITKSSNFITANILFLILRRIMTIQTPMKYRALQITGLPLTSIVGSVVSLIVGLISLPLGILTGVITIIIPFIYWWYINWEKRD